MITVNIINNIINQYDMNKQWINNNTISQNDINIKTHFLQWKSIKIYSPISLIFVLQTEYQQKYSLRIVLSSDLRAEELHLIRLHYT